MYLRIDNCDENCSFISRIIGLIWRYYTLLEASEFSLSYHVFKNIIGYNYGIQKFKTIFFQFNLLIHVSLIIDSTY